MDSVRQESPEEITVLQVLHIFTYYSIIIMSINSAACMVQKILKHDGCNCVLRTEQDYTMKSFLFLQSVLYT